MSPMKSSPSPQLKTRRPKLRLGNVIRYMFITLDKEKDGTENSNMYIQNGM